MSSNLSSTFQSVSSRKERAWSQAKNAPIISNESTWNVVYTDGACRGNGQPNAVAGVGVWWSPNDTRNIAERCPGAQTNNRAELIAIVRALQKTPITQTPLLIKTDSQYSMRSLVEWLPIWRQNGFKTAGKKPIANKELILYLSALLDLRSRNGQPVQLQYVKGHSGEVGNDGADSLAVKGCQLEAVPELDWNLLRIAVEADSSLQESKAQTPTNTALPLRIPISRTQVDTAKAETPKPSYSKTWSQRTGIPDVENESEWDVVFTDGACRHNGTPLAKAGVGVWWSDGNPNNISERCPGQTAELQTNNRAELTAIVRVLETTSIKSKPLLIKTDSKYSRDVFVTWLPKWRQQNFLTSTKQPIKNRSLILYCSALLDARAQKGQVVQLQWVEGHSGNIGNDGADRLAVSGCELPAVPERDWHGLQNALEGAQKPILLSKEEIEFYAAGLLDEADLMDEISNL